MVKGIIKTALNAATGAFSDVKSLARPVINVIDAQLRRNAKSKYFSPMPVGKFGDVEVGGLRYQPVPKREPKARVKRVKREIKQSVKRKLFAEEAPKEVLVGIEPNPGPGVKGFVKKEKKFVKRMLKNKIVKKKYKPVKGWGSVRSGFDERGQIAPVAFGSVIRNQPKKRKMRVEASEAIAQIAGVNSNYKVVINLALNPGLASAFPLLAQDAANYEAYEFKKLVFEYIPNDPSSTAGYVAMNCDYNPQEEGAAQFPSFQTFMDYGGSTMGNAWERNVMKIQCPNVEGGTKLRTVRQGGLTGSFDLHLYDHGQFNLAVGGQPSAVALGTLWAHYVCDLTRARINPVGNAQNVDYFSNNSIGGFPGASSTVLFGPVTTNLISGGVGSNLQFQVIASSAPGSNNILTVFQNAQVILGQNTYLMYVTVGGTTLVGASNYMVANGSTVTGYTIIANSTTIANGSATILAQTQPVILQCLGTQLTLTLNPVISAATVSSVNLTLVQIPYQGVSFSRGEKIYKEFSARLLRDMAQMQLTDQNLKMLAEKYDPPQHVPFIEEVKEDSTSMVLRTRSKIDYESSSDNEGYIIPEPKIERQMNLKENWDSKSVRSLGKR